MEPEYSDRDIVYVQKTEHLNVGDILVDHPLSTKLLNEEQGHTLTKKELPRDFSATAPFPLL